MSYYDTETLQRLKLLGWAEPDQGRKNTAEARARAADLVDARQHNQTPDAASKRRFRFAIFRPRRASLFVK